MAVPKQRRSKSRQNRRKYQFKIKKKNLKKCPECSELIPPHQACPYCGKYKGEQVVNNKSEEENNE